MRVAVIVSIIVSVLVIVILVLMNYGLICEVDALLDRAQAAANHEEMIQNLTKIKENLERRGMTQGYFALIFKTPANNLGYYYKTVDLVLERLDSIKDISKSETAYQVALCDIRNTICELPKIARGYLWTKYWFLYLLAFGIWLWPGFIIYIRD